jgi:hypothetical protein
MKKAATVSRSPIHHSRLPKRIEGTGVYAEIQEKEHKKRLPGCYIESQATIVKKEQSSKGRQGRQVDCNCQSIERKALRSAQLRDIRAIMLLHIIQIETAVKERAEIGHRNRLKVFKVARVDKKRKK